MDSHIKIEYYLDNFSLSDEAVKVYETLLKKFELNKKIYRGYEVNLKKENSFEELTKTQYLKLITCFLLLSVSLNDVRYYNTALKIGDKVNIELPSVSILDFYEGK